MDAYKLKVNMLHSALPEDPNVFHTQDTAIVDLLAKKGRVSEKKVTHNPFTGMGSLEFVVCTTDFNMYKPKKLVAITTAH